MTLKYATVSNLANIIGILNEVPSWDVGNTPSNEAVGTGDDSTTQFFLDQRRIVPSSYTLYANAVAMTETTHYALDTDTGEITLTSAGVTLLSTNALTAKYNYLNNSMTPSYLTSVLERAEIEVDKAINSTFTDGTATNPTYPVETEIQQTEGIFMDRWIINKKPLIDINSTLNADINAAVTSVVLASGDGGSFPSTGYVLIGSEVVSYTGITTDTLTGCTRGVLGSTAATHSADDEVHTTIVFVSDTLEGTAVSWTVQPWDTSVYYDVLGLVYRFKDVSPDVLTRAGVANRFKTIYYHGYNTIPKDITRLTLIFAKRMLTQDNVGKSMIAGRNEFRPEMFQIDSEEMKRIIKSYVVLSLGNT